MNNNDEIDETNKAAKIYLTLGITFALLVLFTGFIVTIYIHLAANAQSIDCGDNCIKSTTVLQQHMHQQAIWVMRIAIATSLFVFGAFYLAYRKRHKTKSLYLP